MTSPVRIAATAPASSSVRIAARCALPPKINQLPAHPATGEPCAATADPITSAKGANPTSSGSMASTPARAAEGNLAEDNSPEDNSPEDNSPEDNAATVATVATGGSMRVDTPPVAGGFWVEVAVMVAILDVVPS